MYIKIKQQTELFALRTMRGYYRITSSGNYSRVAISSEELITQLNGIQPKYTLVMIYTDADYGLPKSYLTSSPTVRSVKYTIKNKYAILLFMFTPMLVLRHRVYKHLLWY